MKLSGSVGLGRAGTQPSPGLYTDTWPQQNLLLSQSLRGQGSPRRPLPHSGLHKSLVFLAKARNAGMIVGAKAPIVLTSRADSDDAKLNSIALALYVAANKKD